MEPRQEVTLDAGPADEVGPADVIGPADKVGPADAVGPAADRGANWRRARARTVLVRRITSAGLLAGCVAVLALAAWLEPNPQGVGTHTALGFTPCGFLYMTGKPCPTCGMTTSFAEVMHGHLLRGLRAQPAGALLCLGTILAAALGATVLITGRSVYVPWYRIEPKWILTVALTVFLGSWVYKMWVHK